MEVKTETREIVDKVIITLNADDFSTKAKVDEIHGRITRIAKDLNPELFKTQKKEKQPDVITDRPQPGVVDHDYMKGKFRISFENLDWQTQCNIADVVKRATGFIGYTSRM